MEISVVSRSVESLSLFFLFPVEKRTGWLLFENTSNVFDFWAQHHGLARMVESRNKFNFAAFSATDDEIFPIIPWAIVVAENVCGEICFPRGIREFNSVDLDSFVRRVSPSSSMNRDNWSERIVLFPFGE